MASDLQFDTAFRDALADLFESDVGTAPKLRYYSASSPPASVAAAITGTMLVEMVLPSDWLSASSGGSKSKIGTWSGTAVAGSASVPTYWRLYTSAGVAKRQALISQAFKLTTSASTAATSNVLTFASTAGVTVGMQASGTGVPSGATVLGVTSTTVTLSAPTTTGVASSTDIFFGTTAGTSMWHNGTITSGQLVQVDAFTITAPGA